MSVWVACGKLAPCSSPTLGQHHCWEWPPTTYWSGSCPQHCWVWCINRNININNNFPLPTPFSVAPGIKPRDSHVFCPEPLTQPWKVKNYRTSFVGKFGDSEMRIFCQTPTLVHLLRHLYSLECVVRLILPPVQWSIYSVINIFKAQGWAILRL